jgi:hypothetical protein
MPSPTACSEVNPDRKAARRLGFSHCYWVSSACRDTACWYSLLEKSHKARWNAKQGRMPSALRFARKPCTLQWLTTKGRKGVTGISKVLEGAYNNKSALLPNFRTKLHAPHRRPLVHTFNSHQTVAALNSHRNRTRQTINNLEGAPRTTKGLNNKRNKLSAFVLGHLQILSRLRGLTKRRSREDGLGGVVHARGSGRVCDGDVEQVGLAADDDEDVRTLVVACSRLRAHGTRRLWLRRPALQTQPFQLGGTNRFMVAGYPTALKRLRSSCSPKHGKDCVFL